MRHHIIETQDLNHTYYTYEKDEGLLNSVKDLLFGRIAISKHALHNVSVQICPGEIVGLLGPNGAGKTTLLKILSGLIHPSSGTARVMGYDPYLKARPFLQKIGMVMGQKSQLLWDVPAIDTLHIIRALYGISKQEFSAQLAKFMDLLSVGQLLHIPVRQLSLGERMKFELVAALIHNPELLFLDEPTIGLDIVSQRAIRDFLQIINRTQRTTIIITSHYMRDIEVLAQRILIIKKGVIVHDTPLKKLLKKFEHLQNIYFTLDNTEFKLSVPFEHTSEGEYVVTCHPADLQKKIIEIASQIPITNVRTEETSLEDAIFSIFDDKEGS
jgi:ABC-2 type transport system ATP-binding protein